MTKEITIVGAGVGGLFTAYFLIKNGFKVSLFDQNSAIGKKFLVAGKGGLNLTHGEETEHFVDKYHPNQELFKNLIDNFSPKDLRKLCKEIGFETFKGTSNRIFPKDIQAIEILNLLLAKLNSFKNFNLILNHKLEQISNENVVSFKCLKTEKVINHKSDILIYSLGGASWKVTGSNGNWTKLFTQHNINIIPFSPVNCGYNCDWQKNFTSLFSSFPLKNCTFKFQNKSIRGEVLINQYGIEGSAIYALSYDLTNSLKNKSIETQLEIDFKPDLTETQLKDKIQLALKPNKITLSNFLRKKINLSSDILSLLIELNGKEILNSEELLINAIKSSSILLKSTRPIDEAISTTGGIDLKEIDQNFMLKKLPKHYIIGEMLDWSAPTGGYLIQGCISQAYLISKHITNTKS